MSLTVSSITPYIATIDWYNESYERITAGYYRLVNNASSAQSNSSYDIISGTPVYSITFRTYWFNSAGDILNLTPGTSYTCRFYGQYEGNTGLSYIDSVTFTTKPLPAVTSWSVEPYSPSSIRVTWTANTECDKVWISTDNGVSGVNVNPLSPNTAILNNRWYNSTYQVKIQVRSTQGIWSGVTSAQNVTTYDTARITNAPDYILGNNYTVTYSKPSTYNSTMKLVFGTFPEVSCSGNSYTFSFTDSELDTLYNSLGTGDTTNVMVMLRTYYDDGINANTYMVVGQNISVNLTGDQKTSKIGTSAGVKRGKIWIGTSAGVKRGVTWIGTADRT